DQSRKSRRMRVRFRDGGPPIGGTTAWDASGWLTPRLDLPNFLSDRRIHHGDDAERDPHHAHRHRQGGSGSQEVHGGGARDARDRRPAGRRAAGRLLGVPLQSEHRGQARRRRHRDRERRRALDVAVIFLYFAAVIAAGLLLAGRQRDASDYFLGHRGLPWWALMLSIVATETSAVTVISVPGLAARGNLTFLQIALGYLVGR